MRARAAALLAAALLPAACSAGQPASGAVERSTLSVFAAASLRGTFTELGERFERAHPGVDVAFSFAGSSDLVTQISEGAPADVFASADERNMAKLADAGLLAGEAMDFATNTLQIVTPPGNPAGVDSFADLAEPGLAVVVCAPQVPCGSATVEVEEATGTDIAPVSEESSVTDVLGKVTSGEADAGLVYVTDATAAGARVTAIPFPESAQAVNTYPIAVLADAERADLAERFTDHVVGAEGQEVLAAAGFGAAPAS